MNYNNINEDRNDSRNILLMVLFLSILVISIIGISFAAFTATRDSNNINTLTTGAISMAFQDSTYIDIKNAMPIDDRDGMALTGDYNSMKFTVSAKVSGATTIRYTISSVEVFDQNDIKIPEEYIKVYLLGKGSKALTPVLYSNLTSVKDSEQTGKILAESEIITSNTSLSEYKEEYELKLWLDKNAIINNDAKSFKIKVKLDAEQK